MASKGQKFNKYDNEFKTKIIEEKNKGISYSYLSNKYNVSVGTIMTWYHKYNRPDLYPNQGQKKGRLKQKDLNVLLFCC